MHMHDEYILERLMQGETVSGEALSREMGLSRAAVWKAILRLREQGWQIEAAPRVGYRLAPPEDGLLPMDIYAGLDTSMYGRRVDYSRELDSTNTRARALAQEGAPDGTLVVAEIQTAGRVRLGRTWISPPGTGIYMSLIMRPGIPVQRLALMTPAVALGVCRGLGSVCGQQVLIKWPNDIVCAGRKLVGMLLDAQTSTAMDGVDWVVAGIGINVHQTLADFPQEVQATAGSLDMVSGQRIPRAQAAQAVLRELERTVALVTEGREGELMDAYAAKSATLGKRVRVIASGGEYEAEAVRLQPDGALVVRRGDGSETPVYAGDVSVRGIMGYA